MVGWFVGWLVGWLVVVGPDFGYWLVLVGWFWLALVGSGRLVGSGWFWLVGSVAYHSLVDPLHTTHWWILGGPLTGQHYSFP